MGASVRFTSRVCPSSAAEKRQSSCEIASSAWNLWRARGIGNLRTRTAGCVCRQWLGRLVASGKRQRPACKCSLRSNDRGPGIPCLTHFKTATPGFDRRLPHQNPLSAMECSVSLRAPSELTLRLPRKPLIRRIQPACVELLRSNHPEPIDRDHSTPHLQSGATRPHRTSHARTWAAAV
jgi:hypothetical protein